MLCVDDSSFNLLSKRQAYPTLGLVLDVGVFLALLGFNEETPKEANDRSKGEHHESAGDPKKPVVR